MLFVIVADAYDLAGIGNDRRKGYVVQLRVDPTPCAGVPRLAHRAAGEKRLEVGEARMESTAEVDDAVARDGAVSLLSLDADGGELHVISVEFVSSCVSREAGAQC